MLLHVIMVIIAVGIIMWAINTYVPMEAGLKKLLNVVVILCVVLWLLKIAGILHYLSDVHP